MVYATAAKGYRVGGGNASYAGNPVCQIDLRTIGVADAPTTYKSDSVWSYEVGTKNKVLDRPGGDLRERVPDQLVQHPESRFPAHVRQHLHG